MSITKREYTKDNLLNLVISFIKAVDSNLVNNRSCFPCSKADHARYQKVKDIFLKIYNESDYSMSSKFLSDTAGKSYSFREMKAKLYSEPVKRNVYRIELLEKFKTLTSLKEASELVNIDHKELLDKAIDLLVQCEE